MEEFQSHFLPTSGGISSTVTVCKAKQMACEASVCYGALPRRNACQIFQKSAETLVHFCLTRGMLQSLAFTLITANYSPRWSAFSLRQYTANWCCALNQHHLSVKGMPSRASLHLALLVEEPLQQKAKFSAWGATPKCCWQETSSLAALRSCDYHTDWHTRCLSSFYKPMIPWNTCTGDQV